MIVHATSEGLRLVEQAEHARQTGVMARALREVPEPRREFERAAEIHDDGWIEADAAPLLDPSSGAPTSFMNYPDAPYAALWERAIRKAVAESRYVGLLVSLHGSRFFRSQPEVQERLHAREDALLRQLGLPGTHDQLPPAVMSHHRWMDYLDRLSLTVCAAWPSPQRSEIGGVSYEATWDGQAMVVSPWPFGPAFDAPLHGFIRSGAEARPVRLECRLSPASPARQGREVHPGL